LLKSTVTNEGFGNPKSHHHLHRLAFTYAKPVDYYYYCLWARYRRPEQDSRYLDSRGNLMPSSGKPVDATDTVVFLVYVLSKKHRLLLQLKSGINALNPGPRPTAVLCKLCSKVGRKNQLFISCKHCNSLYHRTCLKLSYNECKNAQSDPDWKRVKCNASTTCMKCMKPGSKNQLQITCTSCEKPYHRTCLNVSYDEFHKNAASMIWKCTICCNSMPSLILVQSLSLVDRDVPAKIIKRG